MEQLQAEMATTSMSDHEAAEKILAGIARAVAALPEKVAVQSLQEGDGALLTLNVDRADFETMVGAGGRTARSLRTVLTALGKKSGQRFTLDIQSNAL